MITNNPMQLKAFTGPFEVFKNPVAGRKMEPPRMR